MASQKLKCRICGKEYDACSSSKKHSGVFRWQEVACSPECGSEYLKRVLQSRGQLADAPTAKKSRKKEAQNACVPDAEEEVKSEKGSDAM